MSGHCISTLRKWRLIQCIGLAPISHPIVPSPDVPQTTRSRVAYDDLDDGPDIPRPRLSMPLNEDDDSFHEAPPRLSLAMEDMEDATLHSIEGGRRAVSEDPRPRLSMARLRLSERFGDELEALSEHDAEVYDETIGPLMFNGEAEDALDQDITNRFGEEYDYSISGSMEVNTDFGPQ